MTDDRMHDRLTRAGLEWRDRQQPPPEPDLAAVTRPHRRLPAYAAAAAAVVAIAGGGWAVGQLGGGSEKPAVPSTTLPRPAPGVVP